MKRIFRIITITAAAAMFLASCLFEMTSVSFTGLTANGSKAPGGTVMDTTTMLTLTFDNDIDGLSKADVTLDAGNTGAAKGALTRMGTGVYNLAVTSITNNGTITVSVEKSGYTITGGPKTVDVYYSTLTLPPNTYPAAFIGVAAAEPMDTTTTKLILTFDRDVGSQSYTISVADVTLTGDTGAVKGALIPWEWEKGEYELSLTGITKSGPVTVTVNQTVNTAQYN